MSDELKWEICSSDVEDTDDYKPSAEKIISLYESICKGKIPTLEAIIYPRKVVSLKDACAEGEMKVVPTTGDKKTEETKPFEINEFDFDTQPEKPIKKFKLKRPPARQQQKKVARMDKVCSDILKYKRMDEDQKALNSKSKKKL